jgi:serine/threonine protein kinase
LLIQYFANTLNVVDYLHSNGIAHYDLKLENIFLYPDGGVKVADAHLNFIINKLESDLTIVGDVMKYWAPEVFKMDGIGAQSEVYTIGALFYELATLKVPFPQVCLYLIYCLSFINFRPINQLWHILY